MADKWEEVIACAISCSRCNAGLKPEDQRILSVYDHEPICLDCKKAEEKRPDYPDVSRNAIGECMDITELNYTDPKGYCFHHFYPYTCKKTG
jgi:hypothetical protein